MNISIRYFFPVLIILCIALIFKAFVTIYGIREYVGYGFDVSSRSELISMAYADQSDRNNNETPLNLSKDSINQSKIDSKNVVINDELVNVDLSLEQRSLISEINKKNIDLSNRERQLSLAEVVLETTVTNVQSKIDDLLKLKDQMDLIIQEQSLKDQEKIKSLAKMYENMKPSRAAEILQGLDLGTTLRIISNMKEAKVSAILASMHPVKAAEISLEYTKRLEPGSLHN